MCQSYIESATALSDNKKKQPFTSKEDVGMVKRFSKKYGNKG